MKGTRICERQPQSKVTSFSFFSFYFQKGFNIAKKIIAL